MLKLELQQIMIKIIKLISQQKQIKCQMNEQFVYKFLNQSKKYHFGLFFKATILIGSNQLQNKIMQVRDKIQAIMSLCKQSNSKCDFVYIREYYQNSTSLFTYKLTNAIVQRGTLAIDINEFDILWQGLKYRQNTELAIFKFYFGELIGEQKNKILMNAFIEHYQYLLSHTKNLSIKQIINISKSLFPSFNEISKKYGYFKVTHKMIGRTDDKKWKFWMNQNFFKNQPEFPCNNQKQMILSFFEVINKFANRSVENESFFSKIEQQEINFANIIKIITEFQQLHCCSEKISFQGIKNKFSHQPTISNPNNYSIKLKGVDRQYIKSSVNQPIAKQKIDSELNTNFVSVSKHAINTKSTNNSKLSNKSTLASSRGSYKSFMSSGSTSGSQILKDSKLKNLQTSLSIIVHENHHLRSYCNNQPQKMNQSSQSTLKTQILKFATWKNAIKVGQLSTKHNLLDLTKSINMSDSFQTQHNKIIQIDQMILANYSTKKNVFKSIVQSQKC